MQKQQGNSLLEILLVITVSSVLILLAVRYFTVVDLNMRVARAISQVDIISRASYEWLEYDQKADFSMISKDALIHSGLLQANDFKNPWGGTIMVAPGSDHNHVKIELNHLSPYACQGLSRHLETIAFANASSACDSGTYYGEF
ncbi:MAG: hypothetical protein A3F17_03445 [Gammaproteobacteria bacterium RIFCSPHIGHO2_12_FULL_41_15]|nr:MAG: hypothetical protein A3F17_03445 [Gammaproteobacteria bacterium RIFCSPHIGHO2_12_FULL_41_15]